ncbi:tyrosine--tRNA ligase [Candidatus Nardonella dryophthoridicola]|uniref:Tyrosine--tRNA ligase n=1 Tax=endosymbiont of Rhynchophorus ferrugineus TaxID=1972133 RepID=A0A2Z5TGZ4_9GAMM|nr:tyrosine--tRNA ligase [Candidatus Nardonella dryophthoridicola]QTJ62829.1 tyrosine--tRNA ligase [Candidatus Nardonella dryophthoridicola]BBA85073.1 tyrosine--tRNA ligase [endosymbiont of Rhynchophorus ferrugineus]
MILNKNFIDDLYNRKLIYKISNEKELKEYINNKNLNIYCGYDLTYDSLHIGHLLSLTLLKRLYNYGNKIFILIGDSTSLIGDPSFKNKNRKIIFKDEINKFKKKIIDQIKKFSYINKFEVNIINNSEWFNKINIINFIYYIGNLFSIKKIINNKFIKKRLENNNNISFKEFSYVLLQSYDFLKMYKQNNVKLQIGGSDQFSNINFGINLIYKLYNKKVFGLTFPILTDKKGFKLGKSNINKKKIIWLDKEKTTPYELYQYILNIEDNKIFDLFKMLTFYDLNYIYELEKNKNIDNIIKCKKILANHLVKIIYEKNINKNFSLNKSYNKNNNIINISKKKINYLINIGINKIYLKLGINLIDTLLKLDVIKSKSKAKNIIISGGIKINGNKIFDFKYKFTKNDLLYDKYTIIIKGKKKYYIIIWKNTII